MSGLGWSPGAALSRPRWALAAGLGLALLALIAPRLWPLEPPERRLRPPSATVLDARGRPLFRDAADGLASPVELDQIAPALLQATVAAEDRRFWVHPGVDPLAILRAALDRDDNGAGASTITQQLVKHLYPADPTLPPLVRKLREAGLALALETRWSKRQILAAYLNTVSYGGGAYGVEAAARTYFGSSASELDLARAAFLAGLPRRPPADLDDELPQLRARQAYVLGRLVATGVLTAERAAEAAAAPLEPRARPDPPAAPHLVAHARDELARLRPDLADRPGLVIETSLDGELQAEAERIVRAHLAELAARGAGNAALAVLEPSSGQILALVGSADFAERASGQVDMTLQARQPGSALKPFLYAAGFERGLTAASPLLDVPISYRTPQGIYTPENFDRRFRGPVPARTALASSYNVPAVRLLDLVGLEAFVEMLHRFGLRTIESPDRYGLALALGAAEVRLLDLTAAYGALATGGLLVEPRAVLRVRDAAGRLLYEAPPAVPTRVLSPEHAYLLADILSDPAARGAAFGRSVPLSLSRRAAVKTGTTTGSHDNWTVGFTPDRVAGVWVGNSDNRAMGDVAGLEGAAPIWHDALDAALRGLPPRWPERPAGLTERPVCAPTGLPPGPDCPRVVSELFVAGSEPAQAERYYGRDESRQLVTDPPVEARPWAREAGIALREQPGPATERLVRVLQPADGSVLFLSPELARQQVLLRAAVPAGAGPVEFRVDGATVGFSPPDEARLVWPLAPGRHRLEVIARLADGSTAAGSAGYEVRGP